MGYEQQIIANANAIQEILSNAKEIDQLPPLSNLLSLDDKVAFKVQSTGTTVYVKVSDLITIIGNSISYSYSIKQDLVATIDGQTIFNLSSKPPNIDIVSNDAWFTENYAYTYDNLTGDIVLINGYSLNINEELNCRLYGSTFEKQILEATVDNQTVFYYSGAPNSIDVIVNDNFLKETDAYVKTNFSTGNFITLTNGVPNGSSIQINKH